MIKRLAKNPSSRKVPSSHDPETPESGPDADGRLLTVRSAAILLASFVIAVCAGVLTYLAVGKPGTGLAGAVLTGGTAFAGAIQLLNSIIA
jgi:hypothetical protein